MKRGGIATTHAYERAAERFGFSPAEVDQIVLKCSESYLALGVRTGKEMWLIPMAAFGIAFKAVWKSREHVLVTVEPFALHRPGGMARGMKPRRFTRGKNTSRVRAAEDQRVGEEEYWDLCELWGAGDMGDYGSGEEESLGRGAYQHVAAFGEADPPNPFCNLPRGE